MSEKINKPEKIKKADKPEKKTVAPTPDLIRHGEVRNGRLIRD